LPEVVYSYGLRDSIWHGYLKDADPIGFENVKGGEFIKAAVSIFWERYGDKVYEGLNPKLAIYAANVDEAVSLVKPKLEQILVELGISADKILLNVGDEKYTKNNDIRDFNNLDIPGTAGNEKQFIILVEKGKEGWNCRSLFSVALYREPKSTIFVLQATMRCLRSITEQQQHGIVFLSSENLVILQNELQSNFRMSVNDLTHKDTDTKKERRIYVRKKVPVKMMEQVSTFKVEPKQVGGYTIFDETFNFDLWRKTEGSHTLRNIDSAAIRKEIRSSVDRIFTPYSLVAEI
jgi:hypothetical protein